MCKERRLRLVSAPEPKTPINKVESNNFWNTCPRNLELLPTTPCQMGRCQKNAKGTVVQEAACPWSIDSEEHNFCFWRYIQSSSTPDGKMEPLLQNEIAQLFGCSSTKIHFILKEAFKNLEKSEYLEILADFHGSGESSSGDEKAPVSSLVSGVDSGDE